MRGPRLRHQRMASASLTTQWTHPAGGAQAHRWGGSCCCACTRALLLAWIFHEKRTVQHPCPSCGCVCVHVCVCVCARAYVCSCVRAGCIPTPSQSVPPTSCAQTAGVALHARKCVQASQLAEGVAAREQELVRQHQLHYMAMSFAPVLVTILDAEGRVLFQNGRCAGVMGRGQFGGKWADLVAPGGCG